MQPEKMIALSQKRYMNILGVVSFDFSRKAPDSICPSMLDMAALKSAARQELRVLRRYHASGNTLKFTRFNSRMNMIALALDLIAQMNRPSNRLHERNSLQIARIAIAMLLDV